MSNLLLLIEECRGLLEIRLTAFDWTMLVQLSGKERNETMWKRLVSRVGGLSVKKFWLAPEVEGKGFGEGIVEVVKEA